MVARRWAPRFHADGLSVAVSIHLADCIQSLLERFAVRREADNGQDDGSILELAVVPPILNNLGLIAAVDAVSGCVTGITG